MLLLSSKKFQCLCIPLKCGSIQKSKNFIELPILVARFLCSSLPFKFCIISQNILDFLFLFYVFCYMKLETYVTYKPNILRSTFKLATSDLFIEMALKYKRKFTCMIHNKLFTPRASVDFALNWEKLLLLNHNKRTLNDEHASKMLHYRRQKFAKFPVLFLLLIFANLIFSWRKSLVRDRLQILLLILNKFKEIN